MLGTITAITPGSASAVGPKAVGSSVRLRVRFLRNVSDGSTVTVGAQVGRDQARLATTTTS